MYFIHILKLRRFSLIFSTLISFFVCLMIYLDMYNHYLVFLWLSSISILLIPSLLLKKPTFKLSRTTFVLTFVILSPLLVRILNYDLSRIHGDDLITAYFSARYDFSKINFFSMIPQEKGEWVSQFSTPFFVLQKFFFLIFGESLLTIKLSVLPYVFLVSLFVFLITKTILDEKVAIIAIVLYSFLGVSLYLETLGLHFIASTAMFLIFFYFLILSMKEEKIIYPLLTGIFCAFCYLFYASSYLALPFMVIVFLIQFIIKRKLYVMKSFVISLIGFFIVISPFLVYSYKFNNYFLQRFNQVSLLNGSWSGAKDRIKNGEEPLTIIKENLSISVKSLYNDGIGGHGGYSFGHLAFFDRFTIFLFIIGSLSGLFLLFKYKKTEIALIYFSIIIFFFTAIVLTIPPPAYHRFSIAFPFLAIVISLPFYLILSIKSFSIPFKYSLIGITILCYIIVNQNYFTKSVVSENYHEALKLANYINQSFDSGNLYIASFPGYAFEKIYYFTKNKKAISIQTDYHNNLLAKFNPNEKYLYVILFPDEFDKKFLAADKNGRIVRFSKSYSIFFN